MNTVYRRKTKQPLYLVSCYLVSCIYKCSCVYFWQHIFVSSVCVCVCACLCLEAGFCFFAQPAKSRSSSSSCTLSSFKCKNAANSSSHCPCAVEADYFSFQHQVLNLLSHACRSNFNWARRDKTGAVPHWTTLRVVELSEKVCPTNNATLPLWGKCFKFQVRCRTTRAVFNVLQNVLSKKIWQ